jgi:hypothetical protein
MNASAARTTETSSDPVLPAGLVGLPTAKPSTPAGAKPARKTRRPRVQNGELNLDLEIRKSEKLPAVVGTSAMAKPPEPASTPAVSVEILPMDSTPLSGDLKKDLCQAMNLTHSTATDLRSCMSEALKSKSETWEFGQGLEKMKTVGFIAGQINQLMRTNLKIMKEYGRVTRESGRQ